MTPSITLRPTVPADLVTFFHFQLDPEAAYLAAFVPLGQPNQLAYLEKYTRFLQDPTIRMQTILLGEVIVGSIAKYELAGEAELTYWIDRTHWGKGIATLALTQFLTLETARPIRACVAYDNVGSQRVVEKAGFARVGTASGFAQARQAEIEEYIYQLKQV